MDPITIAMGLAQFAPGIIKLVTGSDKAAEVADQVVGIAKTVTGADTGHAALAALQADPNKLLEFQQAFGAQQADLEKAYLSDTQNARARDVDLAKSGVRNHRANILAGAALLLVIVCLFIVVWMSNTNEFAKATISLILGRALGWVEQLFSFEFGTSRSSQAKDATIANLTK